MAIADRAWYRGWYFPTQSSVDGDEPLAALVYNTDPGPPEKARIRTLHLDVDLDATLEDVEISAAPAAGKVVIDADASGAEFDALETRMDAVEAANASDGSRLDAAEADITALGARLAPLEAAAFSPARGEVLLTGGGGLDLSPGWTTLTGGSASTSGGPGYDPGTGALTLPAAGTYRLDFSATQMRTLGVSAPDVDIALFVGNTQTNAMASHTLAGVAEARTVGGYTEVTVAANAALTLRMRSSVSLAIMTTRYQFSARRVA